VQQDMTLTTSAGQNKRPQQESLPLSQVLCVCCCGCRSWCCQLPQDSENHAAAEAGKGREAHAQHEGKLVWTGVCMRWLMLHAKVHCLLDGSNRRL
jgi:hypothetical protein